MRIAPSVNPTALAFLAAKYAVQSKDNPQKRYRLKKKVLKLVQKKWISGEHLEFIVSFVFEYMMLPKDMEAQLILEAPVLQPLKSDTMIISATRMMVRDALCLKATGMTFDEYRVDTMAKLEARDEDVLAAKEAAKEAVQKANEAAEAAKKEANLIATHNMLKLNFSLETIAGILNLDVNAVEKLIEIEV